MVPGHPSHSALGAFHPTPIASSRISTHPTTLRRRRRRAGIRRRVRCRSRRRTKTTPERSTPPSERGTTTSTHTPTETSRDRGTPPPPPAPPPHPRRRRDAVTTRRKTTRSAPGRSRSEEHTSELQSRQHLVCRLLLEKKKQKLKHRLNQFQFVHR